MPHVMKIVMIHSEEEAVLAAKVSITRIGRIAKLQWFYKYPY
jgi:hypothetical protein